MTARELCNYLVAVADGDYQIIVNSDSGYATGFVFTKFIQNTQLYDPNSQICYDARNRTCRDFLHYVAKHNLEDYYVISPARAWRVTNFMDIIVDRLRKEVNFQ